MPYEIFARVCVGALLKPDAALKVHADFIASLGLPADATSESVFDTLRADTPRHKLHEPDRVRYERALEAFVDARWNVDFALGGQSRDGLFDPRRGYIFVGVRVEQFEITVPELPRGAAVVDRPQWLRKGDLTPGSEMAKSFGPDVRKPFEHACRSYARAAREVLHDATVRVRTVPVSTQHDPDWALCRWAIDADHAAVLHRHGRVR